jgi:DUF1680 family protein
MAQSAATATTVAAAVPTAAATAALRPLSAIDIRLTGGFYCIGHLIQPAVSWHRALGDDRLLLVAERAGASYFAWANRGVGGMRVWVPEAGS